MILRLTEIIGTRIESERSDRVIGSVKFPLIDPETGKVVALVLSILKQKILAPYDIIKWGSVIRVHDRDSIVDAEEILRAKELLKNYSPILGKKVETKSGDFLGKVFDYGIDTVNLELNSLFIAKRWLWFKYAPVEVARKNIIEITPEKIVVKDMGVKVTKEESKTSQVIIPA